MKHGLIYINNIGLILKIIMHIIRNGCINNKDYFKCGAIHRSQLQNILYKESRMHTQVTHFFPIMKCINNFEARQCKTNYWGSQCLKQVI